eukprot:tig00020553_g10749.t1
MPGDSIVAGSVEIMSLTDGAQTAKERGPGPPPSKLPPALYAAPPEPADADAGGADQETATPSDLARAAGLDLEHAYGENEREKRRGAGGVRSVRGARRRLASWAAPFLSIRTLFIVSAVLQVISACGFTFAIMWVFGQRNVETMADNFLGELEERTFAATRTYLDTARLCAEAVADYAATGGAGGGGCPRRTGLGARPALPVAPLPTADLALPPPPPFQGKVSQKSWRGTLEAFAGTLARFSEIAVNSEQRCCKCYREELGGACPEGTRSMFANRTHYIYFASGRRGQPAGYPLITAPLSPMATAWYNATVRSAAGASWFAARFTHSSPTEAADPLDGVVVSFAVAFRLEGSIQEELASVTAGLPGTPQAYPGPATPFWYTEAVPPQSPIGGAAAANIRLGALSRQLQEFVAIKGTLLFLTTATGRMFATSTGKLLHVINPKTGMAILASESPDTLTRDAWRAFPPADPGAGSQRLVIEYGGRQYFAGRAPLHLDPNLDLVLYIAHAIAIELGVSAAWLVVCIAVAVLVSWGITRPIDKIRGSMQILLETMTSVYADMRTHVDSRAPPASAPMSPTERGPATGLTNADEFPGSFVSSPHHSSNVRLRELTAFDDLVADMHSRFVSFQEVVSTEAKAKIEMEVRSEETKKFLATVSHEMRTPLNGMLGMLDLARECELPAEAAEYIEAASLSGDHLLALVNDILDLQKMEAGLIELASAPVDVRSAVVNAVRIVKRKADEKGLTVSMDVADHVPVLVSSDPDRLRQILLNLLSNAVKYTVHGSVEVRVSIPERPVVPIREAPGSPGGRSGRIVLRFETR